MLCDTWGHYKLYSTLPKLWGMALIPQFYSFSWVFINHSFSSVPTRCCMNYLYEIWRMVVKNLSAEISSPYTGIRDEYEANKQQFVVVCQVHEPPWIFLFTILGQMDIPIQIIFDLPEKIEMFGNRYDVCY